MLQFDNIRRFAALGCKVLSSWEPSEAVYSGWGVWADDSDSTGS